MAAKLPEMPRRRSSSQGPNRALFKNAAVKNAAVEVTVLEVAVLEPAIQTTAAG